jgi:hypothetical protein
MAKTGKTGADAMFKDQQHICRLLTKYHTKFIAVIALAQSLGTITSGEAATLTAWVTASQAACDILGKVASISGFTP